MSSNVQLEGLIKGAEKPNCLDRVQDKVSKFLFLANSSLITLYPNSLRTGI